MHSKFIRMSAVNFKFKCIQLLIILINLAVFHSCIYMNQYPPTAEFYGSNFCQNKQDALHPETLPGGGICNPQAWSISANGSSLILSYDDMSKNGRDDYSFGWEGGNNQNVLFYFLKIVLYNNYIYNSESTVCWGGMITVATATELTL